MDAGPSPAALPGALERDRFLGGRFLGFGEGRLGGAARGPRGCAAAKYMCSQVLATGLSALYSSLPRKIEVRGDDWHFLRREDWIGVSSLVLFMNSLEFCNAVIQVGLRGCEEL